MDSMEKQPLGTLPQIKVQLEHEDYERLGLMPWFSYKVNLPIRPMPSVPERPHIKTKRLIVRPILPSDLEAFHELRRRPETQDHSPTRGRPNRDLIETGRHIEFLQPPYDQGHWYFGAFLASTGELIGEGGLPDCEDMPRSGWPEAEILIKPEYRQQGYGTELWAAVLESWWDLPREKKRHQLLPVIAGDKEPGDEVIDGVGFIWEETNIAARNFFAKVLGQAPVSATGTFVEFDQRDGRQGEFVRWAGTLMVNPRAQIS
jgi:RimJ/RimL family protein N-acetyltransferase